MTWKQKILCTLEQYGALTDRELANHLIGVGKPQQTINIVCRQLASKGFLIREGSPLRNRLVTSPPPSQSSRPPKPPAPKSPMARGPSLAAEFNQFWNHFFGTEEIEYYSKLSFNDLVSLKMAIRNINNLITYECTKMAVEKICTRLSIPQEDQSMLLEQIENTSENANGFDLEYSGTNSFVCEVKGTVPAGGKLSFGAAQQRELNKDIQGLLEGKSKSSLTEDDLANCYKFLSIYSADGKSEIATKRWLKTKNFQFPGKVEILPGQKPLEPNIVYIFFVE